MSSAVARGRGRGSIGSVCSATRAPPSARATTQRSADRRAAAGWRGPRSMEPVYLPVPAVPGTWLVLMLVLVLGPAAEMGSCRWFRGGLRDRVRVREEARATSHDGFEVRRLTSFVKGRLRF